MIVAFFAIVLGTHLATLHLNQKVYVVDAELANGHAGTVSGDETLDEASLHSLPSATNGRSHVDGQHEHAQAATQAVTAPMIHSRQLSARDQQLADENKELSTQNQELANGNQELAGENDRLIAEKRKLTAKIRELESAKEACLFACSEEKKEREERLVLCEKEHEGRARTEPDVNVTLSESALESVIARLGIGDKYDPQSSMEMERVELNRSTINVRVTEALTQEVVRARARQSLCWRVARAYACTHTFFLVAAVRALRPRGRRRDQAGRGDIHLADDRLRQATISVLDRDRLFIDRRFLMIRYCAGQCRLRRDDDD